MGVNNEELTLSDEELMTDDEMDDLDKEVSESGSELEDEDMKLPEPSKNAIFNRDGIADKLQDISWPENVGWIHKLVIDFDQEQEVDVNDDLTRELAFYTQALEGTRQAYAELESMGIPFLRPPDYYAEMVKSDTHMEKVKGRLLAEKRSIEEAEERRKARESKKLAKEVQLKKQKERNAQKKTAIETVKNWRKQRKQSGFAGGDKDGELDMPFEDGKVFERSNKKRPGVSPGDRSGGKGRQPWKGKNGPEKKKSKRESRDSKFGFGGRKGLKKQNTADSTDGFKRFNKGSATGNNKRKR
ncbi:unnamed protein product [Dovyalis caffra]|uniref:rRNA processing protein EBP2 n=1 Tax=Dovyalis caffra TaxID=77055 RepID=A0AAV1RK23_9ROSI|nr:unnamed protein product [Dovyalis caffra]